MSKPVLSDLFTLSGRRNRKSYFLYTILFIIAITAVWIIAVGAAADEGDLGLALVIAFLVTLPAAISAWIVGGQRCRDFGWTGWAILLVFVPLVGWIFYIAIFFIPGRQGVNRYGPDPLGNETDA